MTFSSFGGTRFGSAIASGDFDNDRFDDLAVGAPLEGDGTVHVYPGSEDGPSGAASYTLIGEGFGRFGSSLATGDVNGDGVDDIVIGAPDRAVLVHLGSPVGLAHDPADVLVPTRVEADWSASFGEKVAAADIDGDGYDDVLVTTWDTYDGGGSHQVFRGGPAGVSTELWDGNGVESVDPFATAWSGDIDGDGFLDLVSGAHLYRGSAAGLQGPGDETLYWIVGDVNGDGFDEAAVMEVFDESLPAACTTGFCTSIHVYPGSSSGIGGEPIALDPALDHFGRVVGVGDTDGDGYADVMVGEPYHAAEVHTSAEPASARPQAYLYRGSERGLSHQPAVVLEGSEDELGFFGSVICGGDLDGDGYGDVVVAAPPFDDSYENVRVYRGRGAPARGSAGCSTSGILPAGAGWFWFVWGCRRRRSVPADVLVHGRISVPASWRGRSSGRVRPASRAARAGAGGE